MINSKEIEASISFSKIETIKYIKISGFKSLKATPEVEIRPLTVLAGANSSGKSSLMQPLLLLKQTLEANYNPGALLLNGANVRFTKVEQLFSKGGNSNSFTIEFGFSWGSLGLKFSWTSKQRFKVEQTLFDNGTKEALTLHSDLSREELHTIVKSQIKYLAPNLSSFKDFELKYNRCFLDLLVVFTEAIAVSPTDGVIKIITNQMQKLNHIPGLRGNPERNYPLATASDKFPGQFQNYTASIIILWQEQNDNRLTTLVSHLKKLGLASSITAERLDDTQVEIKVGRVARSTKNGTSKDLVSIADVGFGVSQTLPVLVALLVAQPGQLVYIEQPELHLHPRAQVAMAEILAEAAQRGVQVVIETHSELLLLGIQTLVAEGKLPKEDVILHWFNQDKSGYTVINSGDLDEKGAYGDWAEDFAEVKSKAQTRYIDAVYNRVSNNRVSNGKKNH